MEWQWGAAAAAVSLAAAVFRHCVYLPYAAAKKMEKETARERCALCFREMEMLRRDIKTMHGDVLDLRNELRAFREELRQLQQAIRQLTEEEKKGRSYEYGRIGIYDGPRHPGDGDRGQL